MIIFLKKLFFNKDLPLKKLKIKKAKFKSGLSNQTGITGMFIPPGKII